MPPWNPSRFVGLISLFGFFGMLDSLGLMFCLFLKPFAQRTRYSSHPTLPVAHAQKSPPMQKLKTAVNISSFPVASRNFDMIAGQDEVSLQHLVSENSAAADLVVPVQQLQRDNPPVFAETTMPFIRDHIVQVAESAGGRMFFFEKKKWL